MVFKFSPAMKSQIQEGLLAWYTHAKRDLPWRHTTDPYRIVLSEFMLQQTQVKTVIPYYHRFLERFPDFWSLAQADLPQILKVWEGLGYYRRAKLLKALADCVVHERGGKLPSKYAELLTLPGIGAYTGAAIASIVFSEPVGVVDGNVYRVFSRVFNLEWDLSLNSSKKSFQTLANQLVSASRPGDFNQAVMELGATVCTPQQPRCTDCPLKESCAVVKTGTNPMDRPVKTMRTKVCRENINWIWVENNGTLLLRQRKDSGLMAGFWELPSAEEAGPLGSRKELILTVEYKYSHIHATYRVYMGKENPVAPLGPTMVWCIRKELGQLPLSGALKKVLKLRNWLF